LVSVLLPQFLQSVFFLFLVLWFDIVSFLLQSKVIIAGFLSDLPDSDAELSAAVLFFKMFAN